MNTGWSRCGVFLVEAVLISISGSVLAATDVTPEIRVGVSHIDVESFGAVESVSDSGAQVEAEIKIRSAGPRGSFTLTPKVMQTFYGEADILEREEQRLTAEAQRLFQTAKWNITLDYSRKDLFSSEFDDLNADPDDDPVDVDNSSGQVGDGTRDRISLGTSLQKALSERTDYVLDIGYQDTSYDQNGGTSRVDFDQLWLDTGIRLNVTERTSYTFTAGGRQYDNDNDFEVDSVRAYMRIDTELSERLSFFARFGYERLEGSQGGIDLEDESIVPVEAGLVLRSELMHYRIEAHRVVRPVSVGEFRDRIRLSFRVARQFSPRFSGEFGISGLEEERLGGTSSDVSRRYFSGKLDLEWALSAVWFLGFEYFHNRQDFDDVVGTLTAVESRNEAFLNIRYRGRDRFAGR